MRIACLSGIDGLRALGIRPGKLPEKSVLKKKFWHTEPHIQIRFLGSARPQRIGRSYVHFDCCRTTYTIGCVIPYTCDHRRPNGGLPMLSGLAIDITIDKDSISAL